MVATKPNSHSVSPVKLRSRSALLPPLCTDNTVLGGLRAASAVLALVLGFSGLAAVFFGCAARLLAALFADFLDWGVDFLDWKILAIMGGA